MLTWGRVVEVRSVEREPAMQAAKPTLAICVGHQVRGPRAHPV